MSKGQNELYKEGEIEVILSVAPTEANIEWLIELFGRSRMGIKKVYEIAFGIKPFGQKQDIQARKIFEAKKRVGIALGRQTPPKESES